MMRPVEAFRVRIVAAVAALLVVVGSTLSAHDVPDSVVVQAFLRPDGHRLRLLVRVPLEAMRDVDIPKRGPGFLDLARVEPTLRHAVTVWLIQNTEIYEEDRALAEPVIAAVRVSLPADRAFETYDGAVAHVEGPPLDPATDLYWEQGMLDAAIDYPITSATSRFALRTDLRRIGQRVTYGLRLVTPDGSVRAFQLHSNLRSDSGLVRLDPRWHQAALGFTSSGFRHVLDGADHLLFLLCLVIPLRRVRSLVLIVSAFTVAHSVTLIASAYGLAPDGLWFPPFVETLIAVSIVYMALENILAALATAPTATPTATPAAAPKTPAVPPAGDGPGRRLAPTLEHRWIVAALFGLVHGFGFSFALRDQLQFAGAHLLTSLLAFNVGVELAQLLVIGVSAVGVAALFRRVVPERAGAIVLSALVAHTGWHWMTERASVLWQYPWPTFGVPTAASAVGWLLVAVAVAGGVWIARTFGGRRVASRSPRQVSSAG
jgi:hypothetical protein